MDVFRRAIWFVLLVAGIALRQFFGLTVVGLVLAVVAFAALVYSLVRDRRFVGAIAVVLLWVGLVAIPPVLLNSSPSSPSLETLPTDADEYVQTLAEEDFETYRDLVNHVYGVAVEDAFRVERQCLDWNSVTMSVTPNDVSPMVAYVTFSDGSSSMARDFEYVTVRDLLRVSGHWVPTVDDSC